MINNKDTYQKVYVTLSDGRIGLFTGPVFITEEEAETVKLTNVQFSKPVDLPDNMTWERLADDVEKLTKRK